MKAYKYIYKITYPNKKIYIGSDATGDHLRYFGSPTREYIEKEFEKDFPWEKQQEMTITKTILEYFEDISDAELHAKETEYIEQFRSNDPKIGYNLIPKFTEQ
ncbi:MAG: hypothetical protein LBP74_10585 [Treponema sp.]|jgi:hypothetical protein|nr:hypothetical protein [Treponema sp.]